MAGEWEDITLGDLGRVVTGKTPLTSVEGNFGGRIPFVTPSDMDGRKTISTTARFLTQAGAASVKGSVIPAGAIMVSCIGSDMGKVVVAGCECVTNQQINSIVVDDRFSSEFVYYSLSTRKDEIRHQAAGGSAVPILNKGDFSRMEITLPPLAEQKAIAAVLGALDDKIKCNRRMNATLEAMARALFQSWFIDFDPVRANMDRNQPSTRPSGHPSPSGRRAGDVNFPLPLPVGEGVGEGAEGLAALFPDSFQDSALGPIPKGWTAGKLGDIGTNSRRGIQPGDIAPDTPYIALEHMPRRCIALGDWDDSADVASGKSAFKKGEILFGKLRPYFHKVGVAPFDGVCSTDILVLAPKSPEWFGFLLGHASSDELIQFTDLASTGTKMPRTNWSDISSFKVALPPPPIAAAFTSIIQPMLDRIRANLHQSRTLAQIRDTLLPKLLSGELSLAEAESIMEARS